MIVSVEVLQYELPFKVPLKAGDGVRESRSGLLVGLIDDSGIVGWGEAAPLSGWSRDTITQAEAGLRGLAASIEGRPRDISRLRSTATGWLGRLPSAAGALDGAILDVSARKAGVALFRQLVPGSPTRLAVPVNAVLADDTPDAVAAAGARGLVAGFQTFKLKVGRAVDGDVDRVRALRDSVGFEASIRLDAGGVWALDEATSFLHAVADSRIEYIEDPLDDVETLFQLATATDVPIAVDAPLSVHTDPIDLVSSVMADVFILKPTALGGLTMAMALASRAIGAGRQVVVTSFLESAVGLTAAVHLAAALPDNGYACGLATSSLLASNVAEPPPIVSGMIEIPQGPGLGVAPAQVPLAE